MIRNKKVPKRKTPPPNNEEKYRQETEEAQLDLAKYQALGYRILYADEFCTSRNTLPTHAWSKKRENISIDMKLLDERLIASLIGISEEDGVELLMNFPKSVNSSKFIDYLREWRQMHPDDLLAIFVDRLNVHRSARVT